jgi:hypothetical protein
MLTADNAYIADICNTDKVLILTKFLASGNSFNKEQPMLNTKKIFMKIAQPYAAITLAVKHLHSFVLISPCWWIFNVLGFFFFLRSPAGD